MMVILQKKVAGFPCSDLFMCLSGLKFVSLLHFSEYSESMELSEQSKQKSKLK